MTQSAHFATALRTDLAGALRLTDVGRTVRLGGWVHRTRDLGGLLFLDLRDRAGIVQVSFDPRHVDAAILAVAAGVGVESVVSIEGEVVARPADGVNPEMVTGEVEVRGLTIRILGPAVTPPVPVARGRGEKLPAEELRLRHRHLDLRRPELQANLILRHRLLQATRGFLSGREFLEVETPILTKPTPEGARDYLVPSRVHEGEFYALPQSPQLYKQLLMVGGLDRYVQIARCFRDEDLRADRQPEFTQIDVEMAFITREDLLNVIDGLVAAMARAMRGIEIKLPLPRYTYHDVMERYGSDKPDLRFGMELANIKEIAEKCEFGVFKQTIANGGYVRGINVKGGADKYSRRVLDNDMKNLVADYGAKGIAYFKVTGGKLESSIAKFFTEEQQRAIVAKLNGEEGDLLLFVADTYKVTSAALSALRNRIAKEQQLYDPSEINVAWVLDFPLVTWNEDEGRWDAEHHPFCSVVPEDAQYLDSEPGRVRASSYDLVCNGYEAASGSIRIHDPVTQQKVFDLLKINAEEAEKRFGFLLEALRYGAPPHGGIALGLDRWVMMFLGYDNIRDVIAFPKTQKASDLLTGAPAEVDTRQLRDLKIATTK